MRFQSLARQKMPAPRSKIPIKVCATSALFQSQPGGGLCDANNRQQRRRIMSAAHPRSLLVASLVAWLVSTSPSPADPIGESMPARITYDGSASAADPTLTNHSILDLGLPPRVGPPTASDAPFQVTGTVNYAYQLPANCQAQSEPASGSFGYATGGTRSSVQGGADTFTLDA